MKPRLVLHIGTHKTGSTAIQEALHCERATLARAGVLLPRTDRPPAPQLRKHCSVFAAATGGGEAAALERQLLIREFEGSGAGTMLLSEEGLSNPDPSLVEFFRPWRDRFDFEVICYLRRPDRLIESLYNQFVREARRQEVKPILEFARAPSTRARVDYPTWLERWERLPAVLHVFNFDAVRATGGLLKSFSEAARIPALQTDQDGRNPSIDMRLAVALAHLNAQGQRYEWPVLRRAALQLDRDARFAPLRHLLGRDERNRMLDEFAPMMTLLTQRFGVTFDDEQPTSEGAGAVESLDPAYLLELTARVSLLGRPAQCS